MKPQLKTPDKHGHNCPYCGGPNNCKQCDITCTEAGGLTDQGLCAGCSVKAKAEAE